MNINNLNKEINKLLNDNIQKGGHNEINYYQKYMKYYKRLLL
jgi:hypothetical protein